MAFKAELSLLTPSRVVTSRQFMLGVVFGNSEVDMVGDRIRQEESTMFAAIDKNCSKEQKEQLATEFKAAKSKIQQEMASTN